MSDGMNPQEQPQILVVGPDGIATSGGEQEENTSRERPVTEMVEQPAKVMRIGNMIRQLLEEVRAARSGRLRWTRRAGPG